MNLTNLLREDQMRHWDTIKWLVSDEAKGEGRSLLLALAFIREADLHLGRRVFLWDHYNTPTTAEFMADRVAGLLDRLKTADETWRTKEFEVRHSAPFTLTRMK